MQAFHLISAHAHIYGVIYSILIGQNGAREKSHKSYLVYGSLPLANNKNTNLSTEPATISLTSSPSSSVVAGESVTLTCSVTLPDGVTGTPDLQWKGPGGVTLTPCGVGFVTFHRIRTSQAGQYKCTAILGGSISALISITVQSKFQLSTGSCNEDHHHEESSIFHLLIHIYPSLPQSPSLMWLSLSVTLAHCMLVLPSLSHVL